MLSTEVMAAEVMARGDMATQLAEPSLCQQPTTGSVNRTVYSACSALINSDRRKLLNWLFNLLPVLLPVVLPVVLLVSFFIWLIVSSPVWAESSSVEINTDTVLDLPDAVHLLQRTGIGASAVDIESLVGLSRVAAVTRLVNGLTSQPVNPYPEWVDREAPSYWARGDMDVQDRRSFNFARDREMQQLKQWWVREMIETTSPQSERLVLMWHSHFATAYSAIDSESTSMARQHQLFRQHSSGNFRDLLLGIIRDPAMLNYLDNRSNKKQSPNENLAREMLELFTMGEGNFDEFQVREAARSLTGYGVAEARNMSFRFESWPHDKATKILFGQKGKFNGDDLVDAILKQPAVAETIAQLYWRTFISETAVDQPTVLELARQFRDSSYDLELLYRQTLMSGAFWRMDNRGTIIKSPVDLLVGSIRSVGFVPDTWSSLPARLASLGQNLFEPPNVAGWPGGADWITPDRLYNRAQGLQDTLLLDTLALDGTDNVSGDMATPGNMQNSNMQNGNKVIGGDLKAMNQSAAMMDDGNNDQIRSNPIMVRVAGENYQGDPMFELSLKSNGKVVWQSKPQILKGSHDTERYGRTQVLNLPWQVLTLDELSSQISVDAVEFRFVNDNAGATGDRNLFVDWVKVGSSVFHAELGQQRSECPPANPRSAGLLYCRGSVLIDHAQRLSLSSQSDSLSDHDNTTDQPPRALVVDGVYTRWMDDLNKSWSQFVIGFTDVTFEDRTLNTLTLHLVDSDSLGLGLRIEHAGCWPDCFVQWPDCSWKDDVSPTEKSVFFPTNAPRNKELRCQWHSLVEQDKSLIRAIWSTLPSMVDSVSEGRWAKREPEKYRGWQKRVQRMMSELDDDHYGVSRNTTKLHVLKSPFQPETQESSQVLPLVAGVAPEASRKSFDRLLRTESSDEVQALAAVLMPIELVGLVENPSPASSSDSFTALVQIFNNPAYQVR